MDRILYQIILNILKYEKPIRKFINKMETGLNLKLKLDIILNF